MSEEKDEMLEGIETALAEMEAAPNDEIKPDDVPEPEQPEVVEAPEQPEAAVEAPEQPTEPEQPEVANEAAELKLSDRAAKRFEELREYKTKYSELEAQAKQAGVELSQIFDRARERDELVTMVSETGASPEQFGKSLDYMRDVHQAMSGDAKAAQRAWDMLMPEVQALAQMLGKELPGTVDPLDAHQDLREAVDNGDILRELALEVVAARGQGRVRESARESQQAQATEQQAVNWLRQFDAQMAATDASYPSKRQVLDVMARNIRATLSPNQWPQAIQEAYASIPNIAPPPKPKPGPVRPNTPPVPMDVGQYDTMEDAIEAAIRSYGNT